MKDKPRVLMTKQEICERLGYSSMEPIYSKIISEKIVKDLGFTDLEDFKKTKVFTLIQTQKTREFIKKLIDNSKIK